MEILGRSNAAHNMGSEALENLIPIEFSCTHYYLLMGREI